MATINSNIIHDKKVNVWTRRGEKNRNKKHQQQQAIINHTATTTQPQPQQKLVVF